MVAVPLTENNRSLASAVNSRINADGVMLKAKASLWRFGGIGLMLMLIGFGIAAIMFGFSYINDDQALADRMATSFAKALEQVKVAVSGNVEMTPGTVTMPEPGKVEMTKPGEVVMTKPGEVVMTKPGVVKGTVDMPRPTQEQITGKNPNNNNRANMVTNYTIFKSIPYGSGVVTTGWKFTSNEDTTPSSQFCYYDPTPQEDVSQMQYLARGNSLTQLGKRSSSAGMVAQCVWFNGQPG